MSYHHPILAVSRHGAKRIAWQFVVQHLRQCHDVYFQLASHRAIEHQQGWYFPLLVLSPFLPQETWVLFVRRGGQSAMLRVGRFDPRQVNASYLSTKIKKYPAKRGIRLRLRRRRIRTCV